MNGGSNFREITRICLIIKWRCLIRLRRGAGKLCKFHISGVFLRYCHISSPEKTKEVYKISILLSTTDLIKNIIVQSTTCMVQVTIIQSSRSNLCTVQDFWGACLQTTFSPTCWPTQCPGCEPSERSVLCRLNFTEMKKEKNGEEHYFASM